MKRLSLNCSSALNIACVAGITRVFYGIVIDTPSLYNAGWISVILGGIISFPLFLCVENIYRNTGNTVFDMTVNTVSCKVIFLLYLFTTLYDGASVARCISNSASYTAFNHAIRFFLLLPLFAGILFAICRGGNAIGFSARTWMLVFPVFMIIIIAFQLTKYRWTWLMPLLGPGIRSILNGGISVAGWISSTLVIFLLSAPNISDKPKYNGIKMHAKIVIVSALLVILRQMMAPTQISALERTRMYQLDLMLTNGRAPVMLQLPLTIIWFVSMFHLQVFDCFVAAALLQRILPKLKTIYCGIISIVVTGMLSMSVFTERIALNMFCKYQFIFNAAGLLFIKIILNLKRGKHLCSDTK